MSILTGVSRLTGFVRNWAMAYAMGKTLLASSYVVANNIPNMIYELVAGGVLSAVFIPIFIERLKRKGEQDATLLANTTLNIALIALGFVALIATVWAEPFVRTQTFTLSRDEIVVAVYLFRFFAVQIVFYGAAAIFAGILNSHRHFIAPATGPIANNVVVVATMLAYVQLKADPRLALTVLGIGTTLGVFAQMAVNIPVLIRLKYRWRPSIDLTHPALRDLVRKMVPVLGYVIVNLIGVSFRNAYAFSSPTSPPGGGPAALQYAWLFYQLPYGIFAVALATAIFPELSEHAAREDMPGYRSQFARGLRANAALVIPMAGMLIALAAPLCTLYALGGGEFKLADVPLVAGVLTVWALGLFSYTSYMFTVRGFYALQDTRTPMITNAFVHVLQIALYATLTAGVLSWRGIGLLGIPAADATAFTLHFLVMLFLLRRRVGGFGIRGIAWVAARMAVATLIGGAVAWGIVRSTPALSATRFGFLLQLLAAGVLGLAVTYGLATLMRVKEIEMARTMGTRLLRRLRSLGDLP
jgi:putative peptidoglycan lipid II flippase